jgi:hypothetical protein
MKSENTGSQEAAMPRPRIHLSAAERTAAWRERTKHKRPPRKRDVAALAAVLCSEIRLAAMQGSAEALKVNHENDLEILRRLISHYSATPKPDNSST